MLRILSGEPGTISTFIEVNRRRGLRRGQDASHSAGGTTAGASTLCLSGNYSSSCCHRLPEIPHKQQFSGQIRNESIDCAAGKFNSRDDFLRRSEVSGGALIRIFEETTTVAFLCGMKAGAGARFELPLCLVYSKLPLTGAFLKLFQV